MTSIRTARPSRRRRRTARAASALVLLTASGVALGWSVGAERP